MLFVFNKRKEKKRKGEATGGLTALCNSQGSLPVRAICSVGWNLMELTVETEKHHYRQNIFHLK